MESDHAMVLKLAKKCEKSVKSGVTECKSVLAKCKGVTFAQLHQQMIESAHFDRCTMSGQDCNLYMYCETCCKDQSALYCLKCFQQSDHTGHRVSLYCNDASGCDCGNQRVIDRCHWCTTHREVVPFTPPPDEELKLLTTVFSAVFTALSKVATQDTKFPKLIDFLLLFTKWGSFYSRLLTKLFFDSSSGQSPFACVAQDCPMIPVNCEKWKTFCYKIVTTDEFVEGFLRHFSSLFDGCTRLIRKSMFDRYSVCNEYVEILGLLAHCLYASDLVVEFDQKEGLLKSLMCSLKACFERNNDDELAWVRSLLLNRCLPMSMNCFSIVSLIFEVPWVMQAMLKGEHAKEFLSDFVDFLADCNGIPPIQRQQGDKEDDTELFMLALEHHLEVLEAGYSISVNISLLSTDLQKDSDLFRAIADHARPLIESEEKIALSWCEILFERIKPCFGGINARGTFFGKELPIIDPWIDVFSFGNAVRETFANTVMQFCIRNSIHVGTMLSRLSVSEIDLLNLSALVLAQLAGCAQASSGLFARNDSSIAYFAEIRCFIHTLAIFTIQIVLASSKQPGDVIAQAATAFGISRWRSDDVHDPSDCVNWTSVVITFLRLCIELICTTQNHAFEPAGNERVVSHLLFFGHSSRTEIGKRTNMKSIALAECLQKLANCVPDTAHGSKFSLKPEYYDQVSVFYELSSRRQFTQKISEEIEHGKGKLLNLMPIETPPALEGLERYLFTDELRLVMESIMSKANECESKSSTVLTVTALSLFRIILMKAEARDFNEDNYVNLLKMIMQAGKAVPCGVQMLRNFKNEISETYPILSEIIGQEIEQELGTIQKRPRLRPQDILKQFSAAQASFAEKNKTELETIDAPSSRRCTFCEEPLDDIGDAYGYMIHLDKTNLLSSAERAIAGDHIERYPVGCRIRICGHMAHRKCLDEGIVAPIMAEAVNQRCKQCPLDRGHVNSLIPVFSGENPRRVSYHEAGQLLDDNVSSLCGLSLPQCLAYNISMLELLSRTDPSALDDTLSTVGLIHLARYLLRVVDRSYKEIEPGACDRFGFLSLVFFRTADPSNWKLVLNELLPTSWEEITGSVNPDDPDLSVFDVFVRRVYLLEKICSGNCESLSYPSCAEFCEMHNLRSVEDLMKNHSNWLGFSFFAPLKPLTFVGLHESFTDFFLDPKLNALPFQSVSFAMCLMCGELCYIPSPKLDHKKVPGVFDVAEHIHRCGRHGPTPILFLTGQMASSVHVCDNEFLCVYDYDSIYTDIFGCSDIGLAQGFVLTLNHERVHNLVRMMLDGEITRRMEAKEDENGDERAHIMTLLHLMGM